MDSPLLVKAVDTAARAFDGCTDRQGAPYIAHAIRVMHDVTGVEAKAVALLHDTLEWGHLTWDDLVSRGFPQRVLGAIDALTDRDDETLSEHVARIRANPLALQIKLADIRDNSLNWRMAQLDTTTRSDLMGKYRDTAELLGTTLAAIRKRAPELDRLARRREPHTVPGSITDTGPMRKQL
ncbi:MAG: HD domain-containing protein [Agrococcus casei]|uniref:HD domain-containing protein n=1 Tax=Agrococcus casei TaxID=343512 RepID=UPI003F90DA71